jgi:hypothetical protein
LCRFVQKVPALSQSRSGQSAVHLHYVSCLRNMRQEPSEAFKFVVCSAVAFRYSSIARLKYDDPLEVRKPPSSWGAHGPRLWPSPDLDLPGPFTVNFNLGPLAPVIATAPASLQLRVRPHMPMGSSSCRKQLCSHPLMSEPARSCSGPSRHYRTPAVFAPWLRTPIRREGNLEARGSTPRPGSNAWCSDLSSSADNSTARVRVQTSLISEGPQVTRRSPRGLPIQGSGLFLISGSRLRVSAESKPITT